jgi:8-oxo-dGTP pyrophosphatase MutT (NUDIX family)
MSGTNDGASRNFPVHEAVMDFFLGGEGKLKPADAAVAIIVVVEINYLMQLRDQKPNIFFPGHWGLFGGAIETEEDPAVGLKRELNEELGLDISECHYFTNFTFDYRQHGTVFRRFYEVKMAGSALAHLTLREGSEMRTFLPSELLNLPRVVPYDSFAVWLHASGALKAHAPRTG